MASIRLDTVLLGPVDDLTSQVRLDVASLRERDGKAGEVRTYANGRRRHVARAGRQRTVTVQAEVLRNRVLLHSLRSWEGQTVLLRDPRGRKVYGVFFDLEIDENITADLATVSLTLTETTFSEVV